MARSAYSSHEARSPLVAARVALFHGAVVLLTVLAANGTAGAQQSSPVVLRTEIRGPITPVVADHLADGIERAERDGLDAYLVELDTPGGLDDATRRIVQRFLSAEVPVIVHVSPSGARAASAGAFITIAAHVAAMSPGTAIGAATPVSLGGDGPTAVDRKIVNDAAAFAEAIARTRGRSVEFAVDAVREGRSVAADEALDLGAIDLIAASRAQLLERIDGRSVALGLEGRSATLRTAGAQVRTHDMGLFRSIQQLLADPNIAFLFLSLGTLGLIYELASPGIGGAGIAGAIFIILSLFAVAVLPVNAVGLLFVALALALFVAEVFAPGIGIAAAGGTASLVLGGIFLFRDAPGIGVSLAVLLPVALVVGPAVVLAGRLALRARTTAATSTGEGLLLGRTTTIARVTAGGALVRLEGAWWTARSASGTLAEGDPVRIVGVEGIVLVVEPVPAPVGDGEEGTNHG